MTRSSIGIQQPLAIMSLLFFLFIGVGRTVAQATMSSSSVTMTLQEFEHIFQEAKIQEAYRQNQKDIQRLVADHKRTVDRLEERYINLHGKTQEQSFNKVFPTNFEIIHYEAEGYYKPSDSAEGDAQSIAEISMKMKVRLMNKGVKWITIPLVDTTSTVTSNWAVSFEDQPIDFVTSSDILLILRNQTYVLATNHTDGWFQVSYTQFLHVTKPSKALNEISMSPSLYPLSKFSIQIDKASRDNYYDVGNLSLDPPSAILKWTNEENYTNISAILPTTQDVVRLKWLSLNRKQTETLSSQQNTEADEKEEPRFASVLQMTVVQDVLHTVGEGGIVYSTHHLQYAVNSHLGDDEGSGIGSVQFLLHGSKQFTRITSVVGLGLSTWTVVDNNDDGLTNSTGIHVKCTFTGSHRLESSQSLLVYTETDGSDLMNDDPKSAQTGLNLPRLECINVLRQTGHIAVVQDANANVEIHEHERKGQITRCDASEVPSRIRESGTDNRPLILSYKYLNPAYQLNLSMRHHVAMDSTLVLDSTVDRMHYQAQVMETHISHSVLLIVQSSSSASMQYLELFNLPKSASMFSLVVNSVPSKPIRGRDNSILLPMMVGLDTKALSKGAALRTSIELSFMSKLDEPLKSISHPSYNITNGTMDMTPPILDLPISVLTMNLQLPETYKYEFSGGLASKQSLSLAYPLPSSFSYTTGRRLVPNYYRFSRVDDVWPEDERERRHLHKKDDKEDKDNIGHGGGIKILTPKSGKSYHFHQFLLLEQGPKLLLKYSSKPKVVKDDRSSVFQQLRDYIWGKPTLSKTDENLRQNVLL